MKHYLILFAIVLLKQLSYGQKLNNQTEFFNQFEVKPINLMLGQYNLNYERVINAKWSVEAGYGHLFGADTDEGKLFGNSISLSGHYYFTKGHAAPEGYYAGPYVKHNIFEARSSGGDTDNLQLTEKGVLVGRQWLKDKGIIFDTNVGIGHLSTNFSNQEDTDDIQEDIPMFLPKIGVAIGYSF